MFAKNPSQDSQDSCTFEDECCIYSFSQKRGSFTSNKDYPFLVEKERRVREWALKPAWIKHAIDPVKMKQSLSDVLAQMTQEKGDLRASMEEKAGDWYHQMRQRLVQLKNIWWRRKKAITQTFNVDTVSKLQFCNHCKQHIYQGKDFTQFMTWAKIIGYLDFKHLIALCSFSVERRPKMHYALEKPTD